MASVNKSDVARAFDFEVNFPHQEYVRWVNDRKQISILIAAFYVTSIFLLKKFMKDRTKYSLRLPLGVWSGCLAVFSIMASWRTMPRLIEDFLDGGLEHVVCRPNHRTVSHIWYYYFTLSKVPELGDTIFIILKKNPLIFLHWYHHATVMVWSTYSYSEYSDVASFFIPMNYTVHAFMYTYYTLKSMGFRLPKFVNISITLMQTFQMVLGVVVNCMSLSVKLRGDHCKQTTQNLIMSLVGYGSYLILFSVFFYSTYLKPKPGKSKVETNGVNGKKVN